MNILISASRLGIFLFGNHGWKMTDILRSSKSFIHSIGISWSPATEVKVKPYKHKQNLYIMVKFITGDEDNEFQLHQYLYQKFWKSSRFLYIDSCFFDGIRNGRKFVQLKRYFWNILDDIPLTWGTEWGFNWKVHRVILNVQWEIISFFFPK